MIDGPRPPYVYIHYSSEVLEFMEIAVVLNVVGTTVLGEGQRKLIAL